MDLTEDFDWLTEKHFSMIGHKMWEMIHLTKIPSKTSKVKEFEDYLLQEIEKMQARWTNINFLNQPFDSPLTEAIQKMFKVNFVLHFSNPGDGDRISMRIPEKIDHTMPIIELSKEKLDNSEEEEGHVNFIYVPTVFKKNNGRIGHSCAICGSHFSGNGWR